MKLRQNRQKRRMFGSGVKLLGCCLIAAMLSSDQAALADTVWDIEVKAKAAEDNGNTAEAAPLWAYLADYNAKVKNWGNAALYSGRLAQYYDGLQDIDNAIHYYDLSNEYWLKDGKDWGAPDWQRAEQLRTTVELYASDVDQAELKRNSASKDGKLAKFEPEYGAYIGMYSEQDRLMGNNYSRSESVYGKNHAMYLTYPRFEMNVPQSYIRRAGTAGAAMQIAWEPTNGLDEVVDGDHLREWATTLRDAGIPIFLRFACEMNGSWVPWNDEPKKYVEKFRLVADVMHKVAPNVAMVWAPSDVPKYSMSQYYPGDEYVDWVGVDLYTEPYDYGDPNTSMMQTSPVERLDEVYKLYADRKPIMICETAVSHKSNVDDKTFTDWAILNISRLYEVMPKKYPRLKAITYFNVNLRDRESKNDFLLRDNPQVMDAYKSFIADPYFLSKVETGTKPADQTGYKKLVDGEKVAAGAKLVPFVKIPDVYISKVEYAVNGKVIATSDKPPFAVTLDSGKVTPGDAALELRVYNEDGKMAASSSFSLTVTSAELQRAPMDAAAVDTAKEQAEPALSTALSTSSPSTSLSPSPSGKPSFWANLWNRLKSVFSGLLGKG